jgi:hypothetical protein
MSTANEKLKIIREQLDKGIVPPKESLRSFLLWFGKERRGYKVVNRIRSYLNQHGLATEPDFEYTFIDGLVGFKKASAGESDPAQLNSNISDPTYRVGRLKSANTRPISVPPDATLPKIVTLLLTHDFSQIPVMTGTRDVKGVVSWKTIGSRLALKKSCSTARDCMEPAEIISSDESLFTAIVKIAAHDYVLVRAPDQQVSGIITAIDFNEQFRKLAEPFLLVGEIENGIRRMLHGKFTQNELIAAKNPGDDGRQINAVADLTFGEYIRLIENESGWAKLKVEIDRAEFIKRLNDVREIRNDVMHFDPDGLDDDDLHFLREFATFLKRLRDVGAM